MPGENVPPPPLLEVSENYVIGARYVKRVERWPEL
jgi:hypothetical protein